MGKNGVQLGMAMWFAMAICAAAGSTSGIMLGNVWLGLGVTLVLMAIAALILGSMFGSGKGQAVDEVLQKINEDDLIRIDTHVSTQGDQTLTHMMKLVTDMKSNFKNQVTIATEISSVSNRLQDVVSRIKMSMEAIQCNTDMTSDNSEKQLSMLIDVRREVEEIVGIIRALDDEMNHTVSFTTETIEMAKSGIGSTEEILDSMRGIRDLVVNIGTQVNDLRSHSNEVNQLNGMINSIAEQTNLLALNASIEAARAGEHGRGFAIVATEVSKLSGETNTVSKEINHVLGVLSGGLSEIATSVSDDLTRIESSYNAMETTIKDFTSVNSSLEQSGSRLQAMMASMGKVSRGGQKVADEITAVTGFSEEITSQMQEAASQIAIQSAESNKLMSFVSTLSQNSDALLQFAANKVMLGKMLRDVKAIEEGFRGKSYNDNDLERMAKQVGVDVIYISDERGVVRYCNESVGLGLDLVKIDPSYKPLVDRRVAYVTTPIKNRVEDGKLFKFLAILDAQGKIYQIGLSIETLLKF